MFPPSMEYFFSRGTLISIRHENWIWTAVSTLTRQATESIVSWSQVILQYVELRFSLLKYSSRSSSAFALNTPWRCRRSWIRPWLQASAFSCRTLKVPDVIQGCLISRLCPITEFPAFTIAPDSFCHDDSTSSPLRAASASNQFFTSTLYQRESEMS